MTNYSGHWVDNNKNFFKKTLKSAIIISLSRNSTLEVLKGFVMLLVVMGHLTTGHIIFYENLWFENLKQAIYSFHMPLFFILSGIIFQIQSVQLISKIKTLSDFKMIYFNYIIQRSKRLLVPFLIIGFLITTAKYIFQMPPELGSPPLSLSVGLLRIFYETEHSSTRFIWFLFAFYILSITLLPIIIWFERYHKRQLALFCIFIIFSVLFLTSPYIPDILYLNRLGRHAIFFVIGLIIFYQFEKITDLSKKMLPISILMFAILISITVSYNFSSIARHSFMGLISFVLLLPLADYFTNYSKLALKIIAKYSFVIFLFNLPFIGLSKIFIMKSFGWSGIVFNYSIIFIYLAGIIGPILLKIFLLDKIPIIKCYTR